MKKLSLIAALAASFFFTGNALAAGHDNSRGFYFGGGLASGTAADRCDNTPGSCENTEIGYKIFGGLLPATSSFPMGLELGYMAADGYATSTSKDEASLFYLGFVSYFPLQDNLFVTAKPGLHKWENERTFTNGLKLTDDGIGFFLGLGAQYDFHDHPYSVRGEYEYAEVKGDFTDDDMHVFSLNLLFRI